MSDIDRWQQLRAEVEELRARLKEAEAALQAASGDESTALSTSEAQQEPIDQTRSRLAAIVESSEDAIIGKTLDGIITSWNKGAQRIYGYTPEEVIGKPVSILIPPNYPDDIPQILEKIRQGVSTEHYRTQRITRDGKLIIVSLTVSPIRDSNGRIVGASTIARDITWLVQSEQESERLLRYLRVRTKELNCLYQITNLGQDSSMGLDDILRRAVDLLPTAWQYPDITVARVILGKKEFKTADFCETEWLMCANIAADSRNYGSVCVCYLEEKPTIGQGPFLEEEKFLLEGVARTLANIIERRRTENELRQSEDKFSKAFRSSPELMIISDLETGRYLDVNEAFVQMLGFGREEAIGHTAHELGIWVVPEDRLGFIEALKRGEVLRNREIQFRAKSGELIYTLLSADVIELGGRQCLLAIAGDITERKMAETEREKARLALEEVYERERRIAETLQRNFLPDTQLRIDGYRLADAYYPALDEAAIGGDVYDIFKLPNGNIGLVIADVSGKGLRAGRYGAMVKYMLRAYSYRSECPDEVLAMLNDSVAIDMDIESFVTCFFGILDPRTRRFTYANAGHEEPLRFSHGSGHPERLLVTGGALGFQRGSAYTLASIELQPDDILFFYTDGVTDARGVEPRMGIEGLEQFLTANCTLSARDLINCVLGEVRRRSGDRLKDDVAMLALEVLDEKSGTDSPPTKGRIVM